MFEQCIEHVATKSNCFTNLAETAKQIVTVGLEALFTDMFHSCIQNVTNPAVHTATRNWSAGTFSWLHHTELRWPELYDEPSGPLQSLSHVQQNNTNTPQKGRKNRHVPFSNQLSVVSTGAGFKNIAIYTGLRMSSSRISGMRSACSVNRSCPEACTQ